MRRIQDPVYKRRIFLATGDAESLDRWFKRHHEYYGSWKNCQGKMLQFEGPPEEFYICIVAGMRLSKHQLISVICHECMECAEVILFDAGLKVIDDSREALNYLTEYFVLQASENLIK